MASRDEQLETLMATASTAIDLFHDDHGGAFVSYAVGDGIETWRVPSSQL